MSLAAHIPWSSRFWRKPQVAGKQSSTQFNRISPSFKFSFCFALLVLPTAFFISHFPLSLLPNYQAGDVAFADVLVPADLQSDWAANHVAGLSHEAVQRLQRTRLLVRAGDVITAAQLPLIQTIRNYQLSQRQPARLLGLLIAVSLLYFALYKTALTNPTRRLAPEKAFWLAGIALLLQTALVRAGMFGAAVLSTRPETMRFGDALTYQYAIPFAVCALTLTMLSNTQLGLVTGLIATLFTSFTSSHELPIAAFALAASISGVYSVQRYCNRQALTHACGLLIAVNLAMGIAALLIAGRSLSGNILVGIIATSIIGALLTAALVSFVLPIFESAFGILTDVKLLELSNADLPLLRRLALEVPGTNHHSFMVGQLAEAAAAAIGANALLARVGCLYHDIGKLAAPKMYVENQGGNGNPHDKVAPLKSAEIITGHVRRGIEMGLDAKLPPPIIDFIPQHHGTRVVAYFYHKAKAAAEKRGESVNIDDFRYPGPKPQSKEAAILMLADGAEASVRSLEDRSEENIRAIIKKIADTITADGQFDECNLTLRELTLIRESLVQTLMNAYHQRVSYPGFNPPSQVEKEMARAELAASAAASHTQTKSAAQ
jgi:hypothetical protein